MWCGLRVCVRRRHASHLRGDVVVPLRLLVLGVVDHRLVDPVGRLGVGGVVNHRLREAPVVDQLALGLGLEVEEDLRDTQRR